MHRCKSGKPELHRRKTDGMKKRYIALTILLSGISISSLAQSVSGTIISGKDKQPISFASVTLKESHLFAYTDNAGHFIIKNVPKGQTTIVVSCLGYASHTEKVNFNGKDVVLNFSLDENDLKLNEAVVVAKRKRDDATTAYSINRTTLDNQQIINVSDISSLLPGGKSVNPSLMNDRRMSLRSGTSERGNASFGTAVEVDGVRLNNNSTTGESLGASTRTLSASNIESVEIIAGIPSVEYGDLSNGMVKVNTRRGRSPFIIESSINQHTRQFAVNKGISAGKDAGVVNVSFEHARSFSDAASPYTAYQRNAFSLNYLNVVMKDHLPLTINVGLRGNIGGYNSKADPDEQLDDYSKMRDNGVSGNIRLNWQLNQPWLTSLQFTGAVSHSNRHSESYTNTSSASTQPYLHAITEGYNIAEDYDKNPTANIILGPTGYWYVKGFNDSKPFNYSLKLKADWNHKFGNVRSLLMAGAEWTSTKNSGRGTYYDDMRYAPTWREYRYTAQPAMNNLALYTEEKISIPTAKDGLFELTAGLREDVTIIRHSNYPRVGSLSPRVNSRYVFFSGRKTWVSDLRLHAGWGKSVKLPSFQILYPPPSYKDMLTFSSTSDAQNRSYYAYYTCPTKTVSNPNLRWQYTHQYDLGTEIKTRIADINVSVFYNKTFRPYMATNIFTPFTYKYTTQSALQKCGIPVANRAFSLDHKTGIVTVTDVTGKRPAVTLPYENRYTYVTNATYVNASSVSRYGLEWIIDFVQIRPLRTQVRLDGNYYHYKGMDHTLFADVPLGLQNRQSDGALYQYIGYYRGGSASSTNYTANAAPANGSVSSQVNLNATFTTHIPKLRLIMALRVESSLYRYSRARSSRGYVIENGVPNLDKPYDSKMRNQTVGVFPEYYSTWDNPTEKKPFYDAYLWARKNDRNLYNDLSQLIVRTNYPFMLNPDKVSAYWSANISVTKEIGDHVSLSFYANNFFNTLRRIRSSQTGLETSLFGSGYVPNFYYGLSLRLKL